MEPSPNFQLSAILSGTGILLIIWGFVYLIIVGFGPIIVGFVFIGLGVFMLCVGAILQTSYGKRRVENARDRLVERRDRGR